MTHSDVCIPPIPTSDHQGQNGACQELINGLNGELAAEYQTLIALGTLVALFRAEVTDRQQRIKFLTETVTGLGGKPIDVPPPTVLPCDPRQLLDTTHWRDPPSLASAHGRGTSEPTMPLPKHGGGEVNGYRA